MNPPSMVSEHFDKYLSQCRLPNNTTVSLEYTQNSCLGLKITQGYVQVILGYLGEIDTAVFFYDQQMTQEYNYLYTWVT